MEPHRADRYALVDSPVGPLLLAGDGDVLTGCWFFDGDAARHAGLARDDAAFAEVVDQLGAYFAGERTTFELRLAPEGTEFQQRVWAELRTIGYGETRSYGEVAAALGNPGGSRAVGLANGRNPISIIVPCHRVIGADGSLTGYGGGTERKRFLLDLERGTLPLR